MASRGVNGTAVLTTTVGVILAYSGIKGKRISTSIRDLIAGKNPAQDATVDYPIVSGSPQALSPDAPPSTIVGPTDPGTVGSGGIRATNQGLAKALAAPYGWATGAQWDALVKLWDRESGWNNRAVNPSSGATGIPQALPPTKMPVDAQAPIYNPISQIAWGLNYIKQRYGNPVNAWAHETSAGWY